MSKTYIATTKNPQYEGMVARIKFKKGRAVVNEKAVEGSDRDLPATIAVFKDLGITLTEQHPCEKCDEVFESRMALVRHGKAHKKEEADGVVEEAV